MGVVSILAIICNKSVYEFLYPHIFWVLMVKSGILRSGGGHISSVLKCGMALQSNCTMLFCCQGVKGSTSVCVWSWIASLKGTAWRFTTLQWHCELMTLNILPCLPFVCLFWRLVCPDLLSILQLLMSFLLFNYKNSYKHLMSCLFTWLAAPFKLQNL